MVVVSFEMQFTFPESEVEQSDEAHDGDMSPTDTALESLEKEFHECLSQIYYVQTIELCSDSKDLMGVPEE
jgi:hypothetical protein